MVKKVAVINDLSGLGKCSLTAAIPVMSVLGVQACPLPTAVLTNQTGYDSYHCVDFTDTIDRYTEEWQKRGLELDGIYTGFLGNAAQVEKILHFCEVFRHKDTLLFVDPVMGDDGIPYPTFTPKLQEQMQRLVLHADVITPNLTEFCLLTGMDYEKQTAHCHDEDYLEQIAGRGRSLLDSGIGTIVVTGIIWQSQKDGKPRYYNLVITDADTPDASGKVQFDAVSSEIHGGSYSGTGDLLASVLCASMVRGDSAADGVRRACRFIEQALIETAAENVPPNDGINFEPCLPLLFEHTVVRRNKR